MKLRIVENFMEKFIDLYRDYLKWKSDLPEEKILNDSEFFGFVKGCIKLIENEKEKM